MCSFFESSAKIFFRLVKKKEPMNNEWKKEIYIFFKGGHFTL